jgi:L-asparaginase
MKIKLFITGGTIDCQRIDSKTKKYIFSETHIPEMLEQGRSRVKEDFETLMLKDSLDITDEDRKLILEKCKRVAEDKIVITHGTDTMVETAQVLGKNIKNKTIVLTGAMTSFVFENSDALFNLGGGNYCCSNLVVSEFQ